MLAYVGNTQILQCSSQPAQASPSGHSRHTGCLQCWVTVVAQWVMVVAQWVTVVAQGVMVVAQFG